MGCVWFIYRGRSYAIGWCLVTFENLSKRKDLIVKAADKGGALVVWRADLYQKEALRQLSDTSFYAKVDKDLTSTNQQIVKSTINDLIVKQELPGRPIVSECSCPTELISRYLDKIMAPIVRSLPSYVKDSQHFSASNFSRFQFPGRRQTYFHYGCYISLHRHP